MIVSNIKGVVCSNESKVNYHPSLQFPSTLSSFLNSLASSSLSWCSGPQLLYCYDCFQLQQEAVYTLPAQHQTADRQS